MRSSSALPSDHVVLGRVPDVFLFSTYVKWGCLHIVSVKDSFDFLCQLVICQAEGQVYQLTGLKFLRPFKMVFTNFF